MWTRRRVEEVIAGCGLPQGLQANNIARIAVLLSEKLGQNTTGSTVSRYCASGLDAIRGAANAVVAGQGDVYIAAGVEFVSRYNAAQEAAHPEDQNEQLQGKEPGQPNAYIAMGLTAENVAEQYGVSRADQDAYAQRSQERAVAAQTGGVLRARDRPGDARRRDRRQQGRRAASRLDGGEAGLAEAGLQRGRHRHGRQLMPAQRRRCRRADHERGSRAGARSQAARTDHHGCDLGQRAGVHGRSADRSDRQGARARPE